MSSNRSSDRDRITVKIRNMKRSASRDSPARSKRRGSIGRYEGGSSDERVTPDRMRRRVARSPSPRGGSTRYASPHREEYSSRGGRESGSERYSYKDYDRHYYARSPGVPPPDRRRPEHHPYDGYGPPPGRMHHPDFRPPMHHEYMPRGPPMHHHGPPGHMHPGPPHHHYMPRPYLPRPRAPFEKNNDNKKDKFPNYLHHIQPEDDPCSTLAGGIGEERSLDRRNFVDLVDDSLLGSGLYMVRTWDVRKPLEWKDF